MTGRQRETEREREVPEPEKDAHGLAPGCSHIGMSGLVDRSGAKEHLDQCIDSATLNAESLDSQDPSRASPGCVLIYCQHSSLRATSSTSHRLIGK